MKSDDNVIPITEPNAETMRRHVERLFAGDLHGLQNGLVELAWTRSTPDAQGRHGLAHARLFGTDQLDDLVTEAVKLNRIPNVNVYVAGALRHPDTAPFARTSKRDFYGSKWLWLDVDDADAANHLVSRLEDAPPHHIIVTGRAPHVRVQAWWEVDEAITDPDTLEASLRGLAQYFYGDPAVADAARVMRLAGSIAWPLKAGRTLEVTEISKRRDLAVEPYGIERLAAFYQPVERKALAPASDLPPPVAPTASLFGGDFYRNVNRAALDNLDLWVPVVFPTARKQQGTNAWRVTSADLGRAYEEDLSIHPTGIRDFGPEQNLTPLDVVMRFGGAPDAKAAAFWFCDRFGRAPADYGWTGADPYAMPGAPPSAPSAPSAAAGTAPASSMAGVVPMPPPPPPLAPQLLGSLDIRAIPPRPWIYGRRLLEGRVSVLVAPPGVGKSTLTIQDAIAIAMGTSWSGDDVHKPGPVWLYNNEDDMDEMHRRIAAAAINMDVPLQDLGQRLYLNSGTDRPLVVARQTPQGIVVATPDVEACIQHIKANGIRALIVDPFVETHTVEENDNQQIKEVAVLFRTIAQQAGCAVLLVHHTSKPPGGAADGHIGNANSARGAGSLIGVARVAETLFGMTEKDAARLAVGEDERHLYVRLDGAKANLSLVTGEARWFKRVSVQLPNGAGGLPGDEVGVLEPVDLSIREQEAADEARQRDTTLAARMVAFLRANGPTSLNGLARALYLADRDLPDRDRLMAGWDAAKFAASDAPKSLRNWFKRVADDQPSVSGWAIHTDPSSGRIMLRREEEWAAE